MWWLFVLLAGDWNRIEWIGAACAATVGASLAELARASTRLRRARPLARPPPRRPRPLRRPPSPQPDASHRAWTTPIAGLSPNAFVVDFDADRGSVLLHDLVPNRDSEGPA